MNKGQELCRFGGFEKRNGKVLGAFLDVKDDSLVVVEEVRRK